MRRAQRRRRIKKLRAHKLARLRRCLRRASPNGPLRTAAADEFVGFLTDFSACFIHERVREMTGEAPSNTDATPLERLAATGRRAFVGAVAASDCRKRARDAWAGWDAAEVERELREWPDEEDEGR